MEFVEYTIGELALEVKTGKTPPTSNPEYFEGEIPWIGPSDLKGQKLAEDSERKISEVALEDKKAFLYQSGTVLISTIGDIGKTAIVKKPVASNQQLTGILVNEDIILPELFYYWIRLNKRILENKANTSVLSMLNNKLIKQIKVVFPRDFEDQYKIVGRLNRIQELIDKRIESIQLLDEYIRSVFLEMFGDPILNEKGFKLTSLEKRTVNSISYGVVKSGDEASNGVYFVRTIDLTNKSIDVTKLKLITEKISVQYKRTILNGDELLISVRGNIGSTSLCDKKIKGGNVSRGIVPLRFNNISEREFYYYFLSDENFQKYFKSLAKGIALKQVNINDIKKIKVFDMSQNIGLLENFYSASLKVEQLKISQKTYLELLNILFQSTLQNAFSEESQIDEDEVFESLLKTFTKEDLKQGDRLKHLLKWIDCKEPRFSQFESYDLAWDRLRELLEDGSIEQVMDKNEIKLKVAE